MKHLLICSKCNAINPSFRFILDDIHDEYIIGCAYCAREIFTASKYSLSHIETEEEDEQDDTNI